ncbi:MULTISPECIES: glycosyl hydrolase family 28-related protein [unclassified Arthrobacter]|uniref:glycosyl hydrolase family 28-related protein n=1 Tax=unclassified Arthrobacter TaxID=235627 RepID=UPI000405DAC8|nr:MULTISPECIES: glycosyl hydrolase family 28-related protein [unclassified Arthrobacter]PVE19222.1 adenylyl cyclase [Arthrobacter sp. Bz4]
MIPTLLAAGLTAALLVAPGPAAVASPADVQDKKSKHLPAVPDLGPNVTVFSPTMPVEDIQATVDAVNARQIDDEMGTNRQSLLFLPGTYGTDEKPLQFKVGYYTEVAGLGQSPTDVTINGKIEVYNRCLEDNGTSNCIALNNFWRTLSNLTLQVNGAGQDGCRATANFWAVSQAVSLRRVNVTGGTLSLMDYCTAGPQFASGGYMADSKANDIINGSQQQWFTRNSEIGSWSNGVWNAVFAGVDGAPADSTFPTPPYTTLETTPVSREKPYLFVDDDGAYNVRVPSAQIDSSGISWKDGITPGTTIKLSDFFVADPSDSVQTINSQLARGKHLLLTPGVYGIDNTIAIKRANTVVLGMGHATLTAKNGAMPMRVADVPGVVLAGVTIDGGEVNSPLLLQIGTKNGNNSSKKNDPLNPTTLSDVYFRIGGPNVGKADLSLEVNSDNVLIDHIWAWRADHGIEGTFGWDVSTGRNGVIINGDNVTATGLFVEHYQEYNVIWNGENGRTVFFQNELPYDPPNQEAWQHDGVLGWAGYKVADDVTKHTLWGGGSYIFTNVDPTIHATRGFEVPDTAGVQLNHILTVNLGAGTIDHVVNNTGAPVSNDNTGIPSYVVQYQ